MSATQPGGHPQRALAWALSIVRRCSAGALVFATVISMGCRDTTAPAADSCVNIQDLTVGVTVNGTLGVGDCRLSQDNSYADYWRFVLTESTTLQIDLTSADFNAFVILNTTTGTNLGYSDDGGTDNNARLVITLGAGTYHVLANSFSATESGAYQLTVAVSQ